MSNHDLTVTAVGWLGTEPRFYPGQDQTRAFATFRMASTRRYHDRERGWIEASATWFTVKAFRGVARNIAESLRKGDTVLVHGRLSNEEWVGADGVARVTPVIEAFALGHDLARGTSRFARTVQTTTFGDDPGDDGPGGGRGPDDGDDPGDGGGPGGRLLDVTAFPELGDPGEEALDVAAERELDPASAGARLGDKELVATA